MKRHHKRSQPRQQTISLWTHEQALGAVPYIASVMRSLREHRLEAQRYHLQGIRLAARPGRPDRAGILEQEKATAAARRAEDSFNEAMEELHALDIYCVDPIQLHALVPFVHDKQLAWFIFDGFESESLRFWRYHTDPLETRRPIADALEGPATMLA